jgi:antitoxin (DNA-binding transcriptional repressor) of toxin-antitoxin stability system
MKTATIAELHEHLDEYLDLVRGGEAVEITDEKGRVAELVPTTKSDKTAPDVESLIAAGKLRRSGSGKLPDVPATKAQAAVDLNARIEAAIAAGTLRRGTGKLPDDFLTRELPKSSGSVLEALLQEREEGW